MGCEPVGGACCCWQYGFCRQLCRLVFMDSRVGEIVQTEMVEWTSFPRHQYCQYHQDLLVSTEICLMLSIFCWVNQGDFFRPGQMILLFSWQLLELTPIALRSSWRLLYGSVLKLLRISSTCLWIGDIDRELDTPSSIFKQKVQRSSSRRLWDLIDDWTAGISWSERGIPSSHPAAVVVSFNLFACCELTSTKGACWISYLTKERGRLTEFPPLVLLLCRYPTPSGDVRLSIPGTEQ